MLLLDASSQEISGCQWISQFSTNVSTVYADVVSNHYLYSYGLVPPNNLTAIYPGAQNVSDRNSLFFFGKTAIEFDKIYGFTQTLTPNNFTQVFNNDNQVYSSGDCAIYIKPF
jgi:uncharacterized membrane protein